MKKIIRITSMPIVTAIMLMQGIDLPPDAPLDEAEKIIQMLQGSGDMSEGIVDVENR